MSNILPPIVARYSVFFTVAMFSSSIISRSRHPSHTVQALMITAQRRYQDKCTRMMRALDMYRNIPTITSSSISQPTPAPASTDICSSSSSLIARDGPPSLPSDNLSLSSSGNRAGSCTAKSDEPLGSTGATVVFTLPTSPLHDADASSDRMGQQDTKISPGRFKDVQKLQGSMASRSSIATLLSVTLTMVMLSLLHNRKRHFRRKTRNLRGTLAVPRHQKSKHQQQREEHKASCIDRSTCSPHSQTTRTNTPTLMDGMTEGAQSLTYSHFYHLSAGTMNIAEQHAPTFMLHSADSDQHSSSRDSPAMTNLEPQHPEADTSNIYNSRNAAWSLSDGNLPGQNTKEDLVNAWLTQQSRTMNTPNKHEDTRAAWRLSSEAAHHTETQGHQQAYPSYDLQNRYDGAQRESRQEHRASAPVTGHPATYQLPSRPYSAHLDQQHRQQQHHHQSQPHWQEQQRHPIQSQALHHRQQHHQYAHHRSNQHSDYQGQYHHQQRPTYAQFRIDPPSSESHSSVSIGHRKSLSLTDQIASPRFEDMTPAEQARYEYQLRRQRHQMHHQHLQQHRQWQQQQHKVHRQEYQHHHWLQAPHGHNTVGYHHGRAVDLEKAAASSAQDLGYYPSKHQMSKGRTANELAWERHCYYQQQQHQEETVAELRRKEIHLQAQQARQQHQLQQEARSQPPEPDAVVRASSLNSITPASLAEQATRDLGLSRSKSVNVSSGRNGAHSRAKDNVALSPKGSGPAKSIVADCPILSAGRRLLKRNASKSIKPSKTLDTRPSADKRNELVPDPTEDAVGEQISLGLPTASAQPQDSGTTLTRRRTLKNIAPSIRSLARRCSSRFSSRPNSYAGSNSDPITQFMDGKAVNGGLDVGTSQMPQPLIPGPDGIVDLRQAQSQDASTAGYLTHLSLETSSVANSNINTSERIPIHRKVTLFRSKTTSARSSVSRTNTLDDDTTLSSSTAFSTDATNSTNTTVTTNTTATTTATTTTLMRAKSLSARPRDSLRLANGRGLDLSFATNPQPAYPAATTPAPAMQDTDRSKDDLNRALPGYWNEEQEAAKRQVMGILAMGRKERVSAKTGQAMAVRPVSKTNNSGTFLSPLALEAQDDLALQASSNWNKPKPALEEDPCQRIAFMLVPKSRYEFQPLVMA